MPKDDKRPPAFMLYVNDFCSDGIVEAMTTEEVGAYFLLLCKAWLEDHVGTVPDDDKVLARWARLGPQRWSKCKPAVMAAFKKRADGRWHQGRMQKEYEKWLESSKKKQKAGSKGGSTTQARLRANGVAKSSISITSSNSGSISNSSDDDEDGARYSYFSEKTRARAKRIATYVNPVKDEDVELVAKVAILADAGEIAEDDLEQVLESYAAAEHPIRNRPAWFHECLANRVPAFNRLLALTDPPESFRKST